MIEIEYRWMAPHEVQRIKEIDRTEKIQIGYIVQSGQLSKIDVSWDVPAFFLEGDGEHSISYLVEFCLAHLRAGGSILGAFHGETLVGVGVLRPNIRRGMAQLAFLQVSNGFRRHGIGSHLTREMINEAKFFGADRIYVSATPSGSAVGFYLSHGFELAEEVIPELFRQEPEDIHMLKMLD
jgi:ribosomal protein S18 acetylase RimI-like enzyme